MHCFSHTTWCFCKPVGFHRQYSIFLHSPTDSGYYRTQRSCGMVMFLHLGVILFTGGLCLCQGQSLSRRSLSAGGVSVQGVSGLGFSLSGGLWLRVSLSGGLCPGGSLSRGVAGIGGLCLGVSVQGGLGVSV